MAPKCKLPFIYMEVHTNGWAYPCCPSFVKSYKLGNVFEDPLERVWNSDAAVAFRQRILADDFSKCNLDMCSIADNMVLHEIGDLLDGITEYAPKMPPPLAIKFGTDNECNLACLTCRDSFWRTSESQLVKLNGKIQSFYLPFLKSFKRVSFSGNGDPFGSRHYRELIPAIVKRYPDIGINLQTNGMLCTERECDRLGIIDNLHTVQVSINAASPETYKKLMKGGNFNTLMANIKWLANLKHAGRLANFHLIFVTSSVNFREMPDFADLAGQHGAEAFFWEFRKRSKSKMIDEYDQYAIHMRQHPLNKEFIAVCGDERLKRKHCHLNPFLLDTAAHGYDKGLFGRIKRWTGNFF